MSIEAVSKLPREEATKALAAAVLATMPSWEGQEAKKDRHDDLVPLIIAELRERFSRRRDGKSSPSERSFIQEILSQEISNLVLNEDTRRVAIERAGRAGRLSVGAYDIKFGPDFVDEFRPLGVRKHQAEKAMLSAEEVQHLAAYEGEKGPVLSYFLKRFPPRNLMSDHFLLVQALRTDSTLNVDAAWWIHPSVVDVTEAKTPVEFLEAFLGVFGKKISVEGKEALVFKDVPLEGDYEDGPQAAVASRATGSGPSISFCGTIWNPKTKRARIHFAYSVDVAKYMASLKDLGAL